MLTKESAPSHPRYALLAAALRACGLPFNGYDERLLDVVIQLASGLLPKTELDGKIISTQFCSSCGSLRGASAACSRCGRAEVQAQGETEQGQ